VKFISHKGTEAQSNNFFNRLEFLTTEHTGYTGKSEKIIFWELFLKELDLQMIFLH